MCEIVASRRTIAGGIGLGLTAKGIILDEHTIRAALRLSSDYLLRNVEIVAETMDGDLMLGLIFAAILQANVRHINNDPSLARQHGPTHALVPDEVRRPISVNALAESLGIPYETTRRHVNRLITMGWCVKAGTRGVIIPVEVLNTPEALSAAAKQIGHMMHFLRQLKEIGFEID
jgi:hypothetical protein